MRELKLNQIGIVLFVALTTYVAINLTTYGWIVSSASFTFQAKLQTNKNISSLKIKTQTMHKFSAFNSISLVHP